MNETANNLAIEYPKTRWREIRKGIFIQEGKKYDIETKKWRKK